jgi:hypothetical protein
MNARLYSRGLICVGLLAGVPLTGCASLSYDRIRLGAAPADYDNVLPSATTRRTTVGLTHWSDSPTSHDAVVILLSDDRRVAGKLHARRFASGLWSQRNAPRYELVCELDRSLFEVGDTSPIDVMRMILADLAEAATEPSVRDAQDTIIAGIAQCLRRWPGVEDSGMSARDAERFEDLAPPGGGLVIELTDNLLRFAYRAD